MEERIIDGERWGRTMIGRDRSIPSYRKIVDGKWKPQSKNSVPKDVIKSFSTPAVTVDSDLDESRSTGETQQTADNFGFDGVDADTSEVEPENPLETCSLKELIDTLYQRFGIYTCYLMREPNSKDIHPITGNLMNNFTLGQTRNQYMVARRSGSNFNPEVMKNILGMREQTQFNFNEHYAAHPDRFEQPVLEGQQQMTMAEYRQLRQQQQKPIMVTEHGRRGDGTDEDELYAEPPINGRTIIRPFPSSPSAERRLRERREERGEFGY